MRWAPSLCSCITTAHRPGKRVSSVGEAVTVKLRSAEHPSPDRHPIADRAVEDLRRALDALGGGVERVGDRGLGGLGAVDGGDANVAQRVQLLLERADARTGI